MFRRHFILFALFPALCATAVLAADKVSREVALRGPEVMKLDWNTRALQVGDLNGDGLNDLVLANNDRSTLEILYQLKPGAPNDTVPKSVNVNRWEPVVEDARFRKISVTTGVTVYDLLVADLNGDGRADLIYSGEPQALTIRYQQAGDAWTEKKITEAPAPIQFVGSIKTADLNSDGRLDLVMLGQKEIAVYIQEKNGELAAAERYALPDESCYGLEICDVDGDGKPDLVYLCANTRDALRVRLQSSERQFGPELAYTIKPTRCTLQVLNQATAKQTAVFADAQDQTGQLELFTLERTAATQTNPSLRPRVFSPRPGSKTPCSYTIADFNGDGLADVAVSDPESAQVFIYLRQSEGGFSNSQKYPVFSDARSIASGNWGDSKRATLFVASTKEQSVGFTQFNNEGRLAYPQPLPTTGRPIALAAGDLAGDGKDRLVILREEKGKRFIDILARKDASAELVKSIELTGLKTDPRAIRLVDANQDGRLDLAVFTPLDAMRLFVQGDKFEFTEVSASPGFRRGLVDNLEASAFSTGDLDGDGKPELLVSTGSFARALRLSPTGELTVVDQFNARDPSAEIGASFILPPTVAGQKPIVVLYDKKGDQFQTLVADAKALYRVNESTQAGKIEVVGVEVRKTKAGTEAFIFGRDRFWWLPMGKDDFAPTTLVTHATDLPEVSYADVIAGDLNNDGKPEIVCVDPDKNLIEILSRGDDKRWESRMHFKVFETDRHFQGRKGSVLEPRETNIADVTGDGKKTSFFSFHDRVLIYPQE
ncbi:MAG: VCBS repeat-containing protein [Verrucomicrobia bacterium]|nr:VCBS repeat-containing protein [Verrucomicrobiota bacterium]